MKDIVSCGGEIPSMQNIVLQRGFNVFDMIELLNLLSSCISCTEIPSTLPFANSVSSDVRSSVKTLMENPIVRANNGSQSIMNSCLLAQSIYKDSEGKKTRKLDYRMVH